MCKEKNMNYWYYTNMYYDAPQGNLDCCSDTIAQVHYVLPHELYMLEYLTYRVHPFGLDKNLTETLPQKMPMKEIMRRSNDVSQSSNRIRNENEVMIELAEAEVRREQQTEKFDNESYQFVTV
jgi:hypothetical protein